MKRKKYAFGGKLHIEGPRHEQGGVPLHGAEVEGGETVQYIGKEKLPYVFSDRLRVPGSRDTFAQRHKQMKKGKEGTREILRLMKIQEKLNGPPKEKMFLGGLVRKAVDVATDFIPGGSTVKGLVGSALKYAPAVANIGRGALGRTNVPEARRVDRSALGTLRGMSTRLNVNPALNAIDRQTRNIQADPSASMAHKLLAQSNAMNQTASVLANRDNQEAVMRNQQASQIAQLQGRFDLADQQALTINDDMRMRARSARSDILGAGLSQLSGIRQQDEANQTALDIGLATATAHMDEGVRDEFLERLNRAYGGFIKKKRKKVK